jgi:hypothetical protein
MHLISGLPQGEHAHRPADHIRKRSMHTSPYGAHARPAPRRERRSGRRFRRLYSGPGLQDRQDLVHKQSQTALGNRRRHAAKPKRHVELEVAYDLTTRFERTQHALRNAPDGSQHEAVDGAAESALFGDGCLLGVGVVPLNLGKMVPQEFIAVKVALHKGPHVASGVRFGL